MSDRPCFGEECLCCTEEFWVLSLLHATPLAVFDTLWLTSRNQRMSGRSVMRLPAVMPRPASMFDEIAIPTVASGKDSYYMLV
jgi:hypothetical protein